MRLNTGRKATRPELLRNLRKAIPLNNNRNQNNRRRGRGNRNQGGGGNQANRIDSRARGNAPQLLDKYKKLAEDAHRNGDRVQAEYYLQFADHYFRVIADNKARQDEQRGGDRDDRRGDQRSGRREDREQDDFDGDDEEDGDSRRYDSRTSDERGRSDRDNRDRPDRSDRERGDRPDRRPRRDSRRSNADEPGLVEASEGPAFEPDENPFTRDSRDTRDEKPKRRPGRPRKDAAAQSNGNAEPDAPASIDAAALPPSFSANDGDEQPAPRRRRKRGEDGTLSAVG